MTEEVGGGMLSEDKEAGGSKAEGCGGFQLQSSKKPLPQGKEVSRTGF